MVREGIKLKKEGSPDSSVCYRRDRRVAKKVAEAKAWTWENFEEVMEKQFWPERYSEAFGASGGGDQTMHKLC